MHNLRYALYYMQHNLTELKRYVTVISILNIGLYTTYTIKLIMKRKKMFFKKKNITDSKKYMRKFLHESRLSMRTNGDVQTNI